LYYTPKRFVPGRFLTFGAEASLNRPRKQSSLLSPVVLHPVLLYRCWSCFLSFVLR